jgi:hypothetical protein
MDGWRLGTKNDGPKFWFQRKYGNVTQSLFKDCLVCPEKSSIPARKTRGYGNNGILLVDKGTVPKLESQQLKDLQVVIFPAGQVSGDDPVYFFGPKEAAAVDAVLRE